MIHEHTEHTTWIQPVLNILCLLYVDRPTIKPSGGAVNQTNARPTDLRRTWPKAAAELPSDRRWSTGNDPRWRPNERRTAARSTRDLRTKKGGGVVVDIHPGYHPG